MVARRAELSPRQGVTARGCCDKCLGTAPTTASSRPVYFSGEKLLVRPEFSPSVSKHC